MSRPVADHTLPPRVLIVGLGIAGLATAIRLSRLGWQVTIVERASERRRSGYFVALFKSGVNTAERLGMRHLIHNRVAQTGQAWDITRDGQRSPGLGYGRLSGGTSPHRSGDLILRSDLEDAGFRALPQDVEIRYATIPVAISQDADGVDVTLRELTGHKESTERFDLLVGADGVHSSVRQLAFGLQEEQVLQPTGYMIASFMLDQAVPGFKLQDSLILSEKGRSAWVFSFEDHAPAVLFSYKCSNLAEEKKSDPALSLRRAWGPGNYGQTLDWLLQKFEQAETYVFDSADQVHMESWHHGRVVLVGDSAWCLTLYSGMGASCALAGAETLGTFLARAHNDIYRGLAQWEKYMRPYIEQQMKSGRAMRSFFTVENELEAQARSLRTKLYSSKLVGRYGRKVSSVLLKSKLEDIGAGADLL
ncbi:MAG: FAD-dependent oxidoreductase [Rothia sp. (in: high G+C Gram-positive bacteria)]|nr:FAD-dependent oxidoreductase [Rothia sp. (in: high G+C Gram-positive bacteria)]